MSSTILITGSSGFIGAHVLDQALKAGHSVRAVYRSQNQVQDFQEYYSSYRHFEAVKIDGNYQQAESWIPVLKGITQIIHIASPLRRESDDYQRDIIRPAVDMTTSIFLAAHKVGGIRRIVFTSSIASIVSREILKENPDHVFNDKDWNSATDDTVYNDAQTAYGASKTLAERAAWDFIQINKPEFDAISINPCLVLGKHLHQKSASEIAGTNEVLWGLIASGMNPFLPTTQVHVQDVALAHIRALDLTVKGGQRFILAGAQEDWNNAVAIAKAKSPTFKWNVGKIVNVRINVDSTKAEKELGIEFKTFSEMVNDVVEQQMSFVA